MFVTSPPLKAAGGFLVKAVVCRIERSARCGFRIESLMRGSAPSIKDRLPEIVVGKMKRVSEREAQAVLKTRNGFGMRAVRGGGHQCPALALLAEGDAISRCCG